MRLMILETLPAVLIAWNNLLNVTQTVMLTYLAYRFGKRPPS